MAAEHKEQSGTAVPDLTESQQQQAEDSTAVSAVVIHETVRYNGEEELKRPASALAWSGLAAGMSMGFSFVMQALLQSRLPDTSWRPLLVRLGYPLGFLIVIIGRQQLFTENTLTAIIPLLARRDLNTLAKVAKLWVVVLTANLTGAHMFAWVVGNTPMFKSDVQAAMLSIAQEAAQITFSTALLRGIFAGWLIAMMVWMLAALDNGQVAVIIILTYTVALASLTHIIAGAVEVLFLVMVGAKSWMAIAGVYLLPTLLGNIIGGVSLTAAVNHAQVVSGAEEQKRK